MYDFDKVIDRKNTYSLKWDCAAKRGRAEDLYPLWVADMDFLSSKNVVAALTKTAAHGVYGYSEPDKKYFETLKRWFHTRFDFAVEEENTLLTPGVVFAIATAIRAYTKEGEGVLVTRPVYYPFCDLVKRNGRTLVNSPLIEIDGSYQINFADMEEKIKTQNVKLFLLCSPHNPTGRVFTPAELTKIGQICAKHDVIVLSDEIHMDFVYDGKKHTVFSNAAKCKNLICTSPGKTFNLAGVQAANTFFSDKSLKEEFLEEYRRSGMSQVGLFAISATVAAYESGDYVDALVAYLQQNRDFIFDFTAKELSPIKYSKNEGTYLAWLDARGLGLEAKELDKKITTKAKLWLDDGGIFGVEGAGFTRLNFALSRSELAKALNNLKKILV